MRGGGGGGGGNTKKKKSKLLMNLLQNVRKTYKILFCEEMDLLLFCQVPYLSLVDWFWVLVPAK